MQKIQRVELRARNGIDGWGLECCSLGMQEIQTSGAPIVVIIIFGLIALVGVGLWLWSLIHCIQNRYLSDSNRLIGIVLICLLGLIGSIVYLFLPKETEAQR